SGLTEIPSGVSQGAAEVSPAAVCALPNAIRVKSGIVLIGASRERRRRKRRRHTGRKWRRPEAATDGPRFLSPAGRMQDAFWRSPQAPARILRYAATPSSQ